MTLVATIAEQPFTEAKIPFDSWTFAIRVWLAMILALFVSFWLQLEAPASAAVTAVMSQSSAPRNRRSRLLAASTARPFI
jgi:uncharacterized membrane protein YccC